MIRKLSGVLMVVALVGLGCGDDTQGAGGAGGSGGSGGMAGSGGTGGTGGVDAPMIDAPADGMPGDGAMGATCTDYCDCMLSSMHCMGSTGGFTNRGPCMQACGNLTMTQLQCRTDHCLLAPNNASVHCQHAIGMGAGLPPACQ